MATPRRRSARLSGRRSTPQRSTAQKLQSPSTQLGSLLERDESPDSDAQLSIDNVLNTPTTNASLREKIAQLSALKTPSTVPKPSRAEMHPKTVHQTTTRAPDSGLKLGIGDISHQGTPSKSVEQGVPRYLTSSEFHFKFATASNLSEEAQKLMDNVREEAARIKAQMQAEKDSQDRKDSEADHMFSSAAGRKIAKPKGKSGRFSDVHMAQFRKMDSIANHASAFRATPGFAQPTKQSLKRSGSKAELDEPERPRTAGKGTPGRLPPPFNRRPISFSPAKPRPFVHNSSDRLENTSPAKRLRRSEFSDVSTGRVDAQGQCSFAETSASAQPQPPVSSSLLSPTKSSLARVAGTKVPLPSLDKKSMLPRSTSVRSLKSAFETARELPETPKKTLTLVTQPSRLPQSASMKYMRPLPPLPRSSNETEEKSKASLEPSMPTKTLQASSKLGELASRLPTFAGLKSILRSSRLTPGAPESEILATPKRPNTANSMSESAKKVDFTPSVKSRYAVKLAAENPSPARANAHLPQCASHSIFDPAAYTLDEGTGQDDEWEDAESDIEYPTLPPISPVAETSPRVHTFSEKAKDHNRRESTEFKSIFTTLHHPSRPVAPGSFTSVNTIVNQANPAANVNRVIRSPANPNKSTTSPSTIRRVRTSVVSNSIMPVDDTNIRTIPCGLSGKKRRRETIDEEAKDEVHDKENHPFPFLPATPGGWNDTILDEEDEGVRRAGKRQRTSQDKSPALEVPEPVEKKKPNAAREAAAKNAKERKGKGGILSLSRLQMLSRPKQRG